MSIYLQCFLTGLGGLLIQVIIKLIKLQELKRKSVSSELSPPPLDIPAYLKDNALYISLSLLSICLGLLVMDEVIGYQIKVLSYNIAIANIIKIMFIPYGYMGANLLSHALNKTERKLLSIIDKKTDIADAQISKP